MDITQTKIAFRKFAKATQTQARANISKKDLKASGRLRNELKFYTKESANSIELIYERPLYADYQDKGVSGTQKKFDTQFKYTTKKPPAKVFEKWAKQKGIKPRNKKTGKFMSFKAFSFLVANKIFTQGIKPKKFFIAPFEKQTQNLPEPILNAFNLDIDKFLKDTLNATS